MDGTADAFFDMLLSSSGVLGTKAPGTLMQYRQTMRWFWAKWVQPRGRLPHSRVEVQRFLMSDTACRHHRVLQALVNRHWDLPGPPVVAHHRRPLHGYNRCRTQRSDGIHLYLPRYIPQDFPQMGTLRALVALCGAAPANAHNVCYRVGIAYRWLLGSGRTPIALTEAIIARAKRAKCAIAAKRVIAETTGVANHLAQVWGKPWRLCRVHITKLFQSTAGCDDLIQRNTHETETKKRCEAVCKRRAFCGAEVAQLLSTAKSLQDRCVIVVLAHTGLRRRAVAWMQLSAVWDGVQVRAEGYALEKGSLTRSFTIDDLMAQCLTDYILHERRGGPSSPWLFPSRYKPAQCIHPSTLALRLRQHCDRLGIVGQHARPHGMRRYTVAALLRAGNRIEDVSRWLGHRAMQTTYQNYWDSTVHDISREMKIPWLT